MRQHVLGFGGGEVHIEHPDANPGRGAQMSHACNTGIASWSATFAPAVEPERLPRGPTMTTTKDDRPETERSELALADAPGASGRVLRGIERVGNRLPHPFYLFLILAGIVALASAIAS